uniref:Dopamine D1 receptor n=1 Tax=Hucho hucho TaxID=62062 RepID=A0A4W5LHF0_9TELE
MDLPNNTTVITDSDGGVLLDDSSTRVLTGCFLSLLILSTLLGNILVCAACRHLRSKVTNFFVISLAVSDLLVAVLVMPWKAVTEVLGFWPFGSFCDTWVAFDIMCSTASILNLCVISVDRYWAISSPFRYERKMTPKVAFVMISVAWTLSVLISFIPVQLNWHKAPRDWDNCHFSLNRTYAISTSLVSFYIPVIIMVATYTQIYRITHRQIRCIATLERAAESAKNRQNSMGGGGGGSSISESESSFKMTFKRETKVLKTLTLIVGVFVCCWLPFFILNCMVPFCEPSPRDAAASFTCISPTMFDVFVWLGWANSSINPVIYAFNPDFRKVFSILLGCNRLCPGDHGMDSLRTPSGNTTSAETLVPEEDLQDQKRIFRTRRGSTVPACLYRVDTTVSQGPRLDSDPVIQCLCGLCSDPVTADHSRDEKG